MLKLWDGLKRRCKRSGEHPQGGISEIPKGDRSRGLGQPGAVKVSKLTYRTKNPRTLVRGVGQRNSSLQTKAEIKGKDSPVTQS
ncbi:hypothetical protein A4H02_06130 [Fervidobacterium thailandense]|uniref:Uncharacterized protein n=1 Tax=Fervidobacterium thailandense TaxID=1008305 RepID=A0A1E3G1Y3_9BACT|nr:hypothetical protein A4H02_06130 [Fervidobacterium thailandense]